MGSLPACRCCSSLPQVARSIPIMICRRCGQACCNPNCRDQPAGERRSKPGYVRGQLSLPMPAPS